MDNYKTNFTATGISWRRRIYFWVDIKFCNGSFVKQHNTILFSSGFNYRAMQYSAKRGLAIACRHVRPLSVTLVDQDHIGWKSWKLVDGQLAQHLCSS